MNPIYTNDVIHLAKEIAARYGITSPKAAVLKRSETIQKHAMRSPSGKYIAANMEEFTKICVKLRWITYTENINIPMTDTEYCIDWDKINDDQIKASKQREDGNTIIATPGRQVMRAKNRRVVLNSRLKH